MQLYGDMDTLCFCHFSPAELSLFYEQLVPDPLQTEWSNKAPARAYDELTRYFPINVWKPPSRCLRASPVAGSCIRTALSSTARASDC